MRLTTCFYLALTAAVALATAEKGCHTPVQPGEEPGEYAATQMAQWLRGRVHQGKELQTLSILAEWVTDILLCSDDVWRQVKPTASGSAVTRSHTERSPSSL